jgi:hypothetical protein
MPLSFKQSKKSSKVAEEDKVPITQKIAYAAGGVAQGIQDRFDVSVRTLTP